MGKLEITQFLSTKLLQIKIQNLQPPQTRSPWNTKIQIKQTYVTDLTVQKDWLHKTGSVTQITRGNLVFILYCVIDCNMY